uniref:DNA polymerase III subunit delta n=1 Tax=Magnetococcus massalia (strain MO-1) TaxID=451514 RepID=A0A1S7LN67_MAGMO|nr:putative DNA polymerase III, delta subunit [Candidatus Magnetococcus massalia]
MKLKDQELPGKLKGKKYPLAILLHGPEQGRIEALSNQVAQWVLGSESDEDFDREIFHAADLDEARFLSACRAMPFMAPKRLVVLKEVHSLSAPLRKSLTTYLKGGASSDTVLLLRGENLEASNTIRKLLEKDKSSWVVPFYPLEGRNMGEWIASHMQQAGYPPAEPDVVNLLVQLLEGDTAGAASELEKLYLYRGEKGAVTLEDVQAIVGGSSLKGSFELVDAVMAGDGRAAIKLLDDLVDAGGLKEALPLLGLMTQKIRRIIQGQGMQASGENSDMICRKCGVFWKEKPRFLRLVSNMPSARLADALITCYEVDRRLKGAEGSRPPQQTMGNAILRLSRLFHVRP